MRKFSILTSLSIAALLLLCCSPEKGNSQQHHVAMQKTQAEIKTNPLSDEADFRKVFTSLKNNLAKKKIDEVSALLHFPFFTSQLEQNNGAGVAIDPIEVSEFANYKKAIFNADVIRLLPLSKEDNLSEIDSKTDEVYYKSLQKLTDPGTKLYEVYMQYPENKTQSESFFAFVFGRVNGKFKAIATYAKWPIK